jgi:SAM-dependent methyltransferase
VEPRFGRLYASAVLRPLAEQVVSTLGVLPDETVCDLMCDGGTLGVALGRAVGARGQVVLVDTDTDLVRRAVADASFSGSGATTGLVSDAVSPLPHASFDRVATLCTLGFWEGASLFEVARRATRHTGRAAVLTWDATGPLHELTLVDALHDVLGMTSPFMTRCLARPDSEHENGWESVPVHDVVRFDGIATYWAAMVTERPVALELAHQNDDALRAVQAACQRALAPCTAADGTMRIPVHATLYGCTPKPRLRSRLRPEP